MSADKKTPEEEADAALDLVEVSEPEPDPDSPEFSRPLRDVRPLPDGGAISLTMSPW